MSCHVQRYVSIVQSSNAEKPIGSILDLYAYAFTDFEEVQTRSAKCDLVFESLAALVGVSGHAGDLMEMPVTLHEIEDAVGLQKVTISTIKIIWAEKWGLMAKAAALTAMNHESEGRLTSASDAYLHAWAYPSTAERFMDHLSSHALSLYDTSVTYSLSSLGLPGSIPCTHYWIPYVLR